MFALSVHICTNVHVQQKRLIRDCFSGEFGLKDVLLASQV